MKNNGVSADQKPASSPALVQLLNDYHDATEQYRLIVGYIKAAIEVLPKAECQLLLEFVETAKDHLTGCIAISEIVSVPIRKTA